MSVTMIRITIRVTTKVAVRGTIRVTLSLRRPVMAFID